MPVRIVQSKQNARLKQLRRALAQPLRERDAKGGAGRHRGAEPPRGSPARGLRIECVFVAQGAERLLDALSLAAETEILTLPRELLDSALATEAPQPIAALIEPPAWTWTHVLGGQKKDAALVLVLAGLQDPGNLGTILRSAEAFGANGILCLPGTVSAWNQKAVRASAGSVFRLPLLAMSEKACFDQLRQAGVKVLTTAVHDAEPADCVDLTEGGSAIDR